MNYLNTSIKYREHEVLYKSVIVLGYIHVAAVCGLYLCFGSASMKTILFNILLYVAADLGITAGAHRLWSHKSFKAKLSLQIILMLFSSIACQFTIFTWIRNHRMHHKYVDTDADPHNFSRGFFFSHIGWILVKEHKDFIDKLETIEMSDIQSNSILMFQKKYAVPLLTFMCFIMPSCIPMLLWGESFINSWHITMLRYCIGLHCIFCINSFSHSIGYKPYDKRIAPTENLAVSFITLGEGNHNFHHTFPNDYRSDEWGRGYLNLTTAFIELCQKIGWAYDMKSVSPETVRTRAERTGDGSYTLKTNQK